MGEYIQACGCRASVESSVTGRYEWGRITYCPRHAAADELREALDYAIKWIDEVIEAELASLPLLQYEKLCAALALADDKDMEKKNE